LSIAGESVRSVLVEAVPLVGVFAQPEAPPGHVAPLVEVVPRVPLVLVFGVGRGGGGGVGVGGGQRDGGAPAPGGPAPTAPAAAAAPGPAVRLPAPILSHTVGYGLLQTKSAIFFRLQQKTMSFR